MVIAKSRTVRWWLPVAGIGVLSQVTGCQIAGDLANSGAVVQTLQAFFLDFTRQVVAAWLF